MNPLRNPVTHTKKLCHHRRQNLTGSEDTGFLDTWLQMNAVVVNARSGTIDYTDYDSLQLKYDL